MIVHIFNPEHDLALAADLANFTAPHAGRQLRHDLGYLPAMWAGEGERVLVDDADQAQREYEKVVQAARRYLGVQLPQRDEMFVAERGRQLVSADGVNPWGWDRALKARLQRGGVSLAVMPSEDVLGDVRLLSHRRTSMQLLQQLQGDGIVGEAFECQQLEEVKTLVERYGRVVLKAPWSSSGRGLRFVDAASLTSQHVQGWFNNLQKLQGSVMAEPFYHKVKDFGMEFRVLSDGQIQYLGLSLFHTVNGAYIGNILATEKEKRKMISRYLSVDLLDEVKTKICALMEPVLKGRYTGPFGVDMMVVLSHDSDQDALLHPCVEINLRRTMGHVALALTPQDDEVKRVMRIEYSDHVYKLKIQRL